MKLKNTLDIGSGDDRHDSRKPAILDNLEITLLSCSSPHLSHPRNNRRYFWCPTRRWARKKDGVEEAMRREKRWNSQIERGERDANIIVKTASAVASKRNLRASRTPRPYMSACRSHFLTRTTRNDVAVSLLCNIHPLAGPRRDSPFVRYRRVYINIGMSRHIVPNIIISWLSDVSPRNICRLSCFICNISFKKIDVEYSRCGDYFRYLC